MRQFLLQAHQNIAAAHDVGRVCLFGSYARGDATANSDIDLRVDKGRLKGLFARPVHMRDWAAV